MTRDEWTVEASLCGECVNAALPQAKLCFKHKMLYYQINGAPGLPATSKPKHTGEQKLRRPADNNNGWERGIKTDERGIPILSPKSGKPMRMKEYSENRHEVDAQVKALKSS
jgi:hypothetical protein